MLNQITTFKTTLYPLDRHMHFIHSKNWTQILHTSFRQDIDYESLITSYLISINKKLWSAPKSMHNKLNCYNIMYIKCDIFSQNHSNNYCCFSSWKISTIGSGSSFVKIVCRAYVHAWMRCIGIINCIYHYSTSQARCSDLFELFACFYNRQILCFNLLLLPNFFTKQTMFGNSWLRITWGIWLFYCFEVGQPFNRFYIVI